jgi:hypothetical protein
MKLEHKCNYDERREKAYPSVTEQLDMLWHGMNNGEAPKLEPFYSEIKAIKDKFPKPAEEE